MHSTACVVQSVHGCLYAHCSVVRISIYYRSCMVNGGPNSLCVLNLISMRWLYRISLIFKEGISHVSGILRATLGHVDYAPNIFNIVINTLWLVSGCGNLPPPPLREGWKSADTKMYFLWVGWATHCNQFN